jgi:hypothetical protein
MSNEAVRFNPLDQWPGMADLPQTRGKSRQIFPRSAAPKSIACEQCLVMSVLRGRKSSALSEFFAF